MLKRIGMLLGLYRPQVRCDTCGVVSADRSLSALLPFLWLEMLGSVVYTALAAFFIWAAYWFAWNWPLAIFMSCVEVHFVFFHTPDLSCPHCHQSADLKKTR